jgi:cephalosporin hydroxylase
MKPRKDPQPLMNVWARKIVQQHIREIGPKATYLEVGSRHGGSLCLFGRMMDDGAKLIAVDYPSPPPANNAGEKLLATAEKLRGEGIDANAIIGSSYDPATIAKVAEALEGRQVDVLLIDGDHSIYGVAADAHNYAPLVRPGGLVIFHDCGECENDGMARRHRPSVNAAWRDLGEKRNTLLVQGFTGFGLVWM